ncbi:MAG TPA: hypothetical protein VFP73_17805, partial [Terrabacter sp.]|nr:hypothetical protein [Terrabacter sp.]
MIDTPTQSDAAVTDVAAQLPPAAATPAPSPRTRARRRRAVLAGARLAIVVVLLVTWQACVDAKVVDPF